MFQHLCFRYVIYETDCRNIFEFDFLFPKEHTETKHCRTQIFRSRLTKFGQKSFD